MTSSWPETLVLMKQEAQPLLNLLISPSTSSGGSQQRPPGLRIAAREEMVTEQDSGHGELGIV